MIKQWMARMFGHSRPTIDRTAAERAEIVALDREEDRLASGLAVLRGERRDDVLAEAYRRADLQMIERRQRR